MLVFFLFCGKWLFALKLVFLHFEFVFCVYFPCFYHLSHYLGTFSLVLGRLSRYMGLFPSFYLPYIIWMCRSPVTPFHLPFCFVPLVLGVRIRLILVFLS